MTRRIFKSILIAALAVLLSCIALIMGVLYNYFSTLHNNATKAEAVFIAQGIETAGRSYLDGLEPTDKTRITLIDTDGTVLFDTAADTAAMENHADREEVAEAFQIGVGESERYSSTLAEKTYYYAVRLSDQTVVRVSTTSYSVFMLIIGMLQPIVVVLILSVVISAFLASKLSKKIVEPINELDLEQPELDTAYEELSPLLGRIAAQNKQIQSQFEELQQRQQEFTTITENMSEGLLIVDSQTNVLSFNTSALKLLGANRTPGNQSVLTLNRSESFRNAVDTALNGQHSECNMQFEGRLYQLIANPVYQGEVIIGAVMVILDVTEKEERESLRREFTANVSHELKTPLTSISGFAEIIRSGIARPEDIPHFAEKICEEAQRLIMLVGDIIKLSQLDENTIPLEKEPVNLEEIVNSTLERLRPAAEKRRISFFLHTQPVTVKGARQILEEMIYNLCDNAIKYNKDGGTVNVSLEKTDKGILFSVKDTGIGIPAGDTQRVFERFYRVDKSHSKEIGGTGLGLSIVKHGAVYHGATVDLESELGRGTTVTILFPEMTQAES